MEEQGVGVSTKARLFNSPVETGVRALVVLDAAHPRGFDLTELTWLDHLVVHTGDIAGPESLHPNVPHRNAELLVRRTLVEEGVILMRRLHMVETKYGSSGIEYAASEAAGQFVCLLRSEYGRALRSRAAWLIGYLQEHGDDHLREVISSKIGRWSVEFQANVRRGGDS